MPLDQRLGKALLQMAVARAKKQGGTWDRDMPRPSGGPYGSGTTPPGTHIFPIPGMRGPNEAITNWPAGFRSPVPPVPPNPEGGEDPVAGAYGPQALKAYQDFRAKNPPGNGPEHVADRGRDAMILSRLMHDANAFEDADPRTPRGWQPPSPLTRGGAAAIYRR